MLVLLSASDFADQREYERKEEAVMNLWERVSKLLETELHLDTSEILVPSQNVIWKVQMHR